MKKIDLLKDISEIISPLSSAIVETFLTPRLKELDKEITISSKIIHNKISNRFKNYLERSYEKYSILNTLVFHNRHRLLKSLYIPLTIEGNLKENDFEIKIDDNFYNFICDSVKKLLIVDTAGMGKSTIMKRLFLNIIDNNAGIPVLIELRRLNSKKSILDEIYEQLNPIDNEFNKDFINRLIKKGNFIFLLDGFDEISFSERENVTTDIQDFIAKSRKNVFVLTSRPEEAISSFGAFTKFNIRALNLEESFKLLKKYDPSGKISTQLITKIKESSLENVKEFLKNPLLVTLLFTAFEYKQIIPFKKHIFYRQVYDAFFESHDLTKGDSYLREKSSGLDIDDFHQILRCIGYSCLFIQKIEFTKDEILELIHKANTFCDGIEFKESSFLNDLLKAVPLFSKDGNYYRWSHKSLQEYFAAQFIYLDSKNKKEQILRKMVNNPNYLNFINLLDIYCSIDYKSFRNTIVKLVIEDFIEYYESTYKEYKEIDPSHLDERKSISYLSNLSFGKKLKLLKEDNMELTEGYGFQSDPADGNLIINDMDGYFLKVEIQKYSRLVELINRHNFKIFKKMEKEPENEKESENDNSALNSLFSYLKKVYYDLSTGFKIDDSKGKIFNTKNDFQKFTKIRNIISYSRLLDYNLCRKMLDEINEKIQKEESEDFLIDGL